MHIKVHKGDEVAIDTNNNQAEYCSDGTPGQLTFFNPILSLGDGFRSSQGVDDCLLLVQAVIRTEAAPLGGGAGSMGGAFGGTAGRQRRAPVATGARLHLWCAARSVEL